MRKAVLIALCLAGAALADDPPMCEDGLVAFQDCHGVWQCAELGGPEGEPVEFKICDTDETSCFLRVDEPCPDSD